MSNTTFELDYRQLASYQLKQPLNWHQDPPIWLLTLDEYNMIQDGAMLVDPAGNRVVKGQTEWTLEMVALDTNAYVNLGVAGHLFVEDDKFIPEGVTFPSAG